MEAAALEERAAFPPVPADTVLPSAIPEGYTFHKYDRKTKKNWGGIAVVSFYSLALIVYFFVRVTKTMDLGRYLPYGVIVFIIEVSWLGGGGGGGNECVWERGGIGCVFSTPFFFTHPFPPTPTPPNRCAVPPPPSSTAPTWCWTLCLKPPPQTTHQT